MLMRAPGRVFTRIELCERVWEHEHEYDTKLVEVFIGRLRKKISDPPLFRRYATSANHNLRRLAKVTTALPFRCGA